MTLCVSYIKSCLSEIKQFLNSNPRRKIYFLGAMLAGISSHTILGDAFVSPDNAWSGPMVFALIFAMPVLYAYHLSWANLRLLRIQRVMVRTEKMLRDHNEELELGRLQLADMAHKDRLTGLKNRRQFDFLFKKYFKSAECGVESFALLLIDLNDFKPVNDTYGHAVGDSLLREVGERLREVSRGTRSDVFRLGGDEFAILVTLVSKFDVTSFKDKISLAISEPYYLGDLCVNITTALGVCVYNDQNTTKDIFVQADRNLYAAKSLKPDIVAANEPNKVIALK